MNKKLHEYYQCNNWTSDMPVYNASDVSTVCKDNQVVFSDRYFDLVFAELWFLPFPWNDQEWTQRILHAGRSRKLWKSKLSILDLIFDLTFDIACSVNVSFNVIHVGYITATVSLDLRHQSGQSTMRLFIYYRLGRARVIETLELLRKFNPNKDSLRATVSATRVR